MTRTNLWKLSFVVALTLVSLLSSVPSAHAYVCSGTHTSAVYTGTGSNCANAQSAMQAQAYSASNHYCIVTDPYADSACLRSTTITTACASIGNGLFSVSGYITFGCNRCGYVGGPICP